MLAGLATLMASLAGAPGATITAAGDADCATGWAVTDSTATVRMIDVVALRPDRAVAVGSVGAPGRRNMASRWWDGAGWTTRLGPQLPGDEGLVAVAAHADRVWAVGFRQRGGGTDPLAARWRAGRWVVDSPPTSGKGASLLADVDIDPSGGVWAVGVETSLVPKRRAVVWHRVGSGWERIDLAAPAGTALTAVLALGPDDVWAAGSRTSDAGITPLLVHWDGRGWSSQEIAVLGIDAGISALAGTADGPRWAVGWDTPDGVRRPLVLQDPGDGWRVVPAPDPGGSVSLLTDTSVDAAGRPWVVGTAYRDEAGGFEGVAARLEEPGWHLWPTPPEVGDWFDAVTGDPTADGWTIDRSTQRSSARRACEPIAQALRAASGTATANRGPGASGPSRRALGLRSVRPMAAPGALPAGIVARDVAERVGLGEREMSHGATVDDVDGDGDLDLFISHHGRRTMLRTWDGTRYVPGAKDQFARTDRHDCELGRVDPGPLPDLVCAVGADGGLGIKGNQLYLDPGTGASREVAAVAGIADVYGRGREIALFDADGDGDLDLFMGTTSLRFDAQPSPDRLFLNDGAGGFTWDPASGLGGDRGAECAIPVDLDLDGDQDLVRCAFSGAISDAGEIVLHRNDGGRFTDVTRPMGVRTIGEVDAAAAQLGGDARPDLVQLAATRIRISLWSDGRYRPVYERAIDGGRAVAVGDVDGDGALDLYLLRGSSTANEADLVLLNGGDGRSWTPAAIPSPTTGSAEDVIAYDHDANGLTDFLVLNGRTRPGPIALIAFRRR